MNTLPESTSTSATGQATGYPWDVCLGRFFKRLLWGALAWVGALILLAGSATPYGNSDRSLSFLVVVVTTAALLWALSGFIPPGRFKFEIEDNSV